MDLARLAAAVQRRIRIYLLCHAVTLRVSVNEEAMQMELTRPLNLLMICAAFAFVGAMVIGVVP